MNDTAQSTATPEYLQRSKTRVRVHTQAGVVEGDYSHAPGVRLSDSLRNAASGERYLLLTDVTIDRVHAAAGEFRDEAAFVLLSTSHASLLIPLEEE
jgi:hypothetical protein